VTSVAGEIREPHRLLPRILLVGTGVCIALFVGVNAVYIYMVPLTQMRGVPTVAPLVMEKLCGPIGATVVTIMVMISTLGASHGSIITGARVTFAQARDGLLFRVLGRIHHRYQTPHVALWCQAILSCVAVCFLKHFERLTGGFVFTMWIFYAAAAISMIVLRIRRPELGRPCRCWGYPVVPVVFIAASLLITVLAIKASPVETLAWLGILVAGAPAYYLWRRWVPVEEHVPVGLCPGCGYNLHGLREQRCPECGRTFTFEEVRSTPQSLGFATALQEAKGPSEPEEPVGRHL